MTRFVLPSKAIDTDETFQVDFSPYMPAGITASVLNVSVTTIYGTDANPSAIIRGSAFTAAGMVTVSLTGGVVGVIYSIAVAVTLAGVAPYGGTVVTQNAYLSVISNLPLDGGIPTDPNQSILDLLASTTGAGLIGYSSAITYNPGTVGYALDQFALTTGAGEIGYSSSVTYPPGTVGAEFLNKTSVIANVAAMRAFTLLNTTELYVRTLGYYTNGDGGEGWYWYDSSDTTSADNGGTIIVDAGGRRWKLGDPHTVTTKQFGVKSDGVTDDSVAAQAAITWCRIQGGVQVKLIWKTGTTKINSGLVFGSGQYIEFEQGVTIDASGLPNETTSLFSASNQTSVVMIGNGATINGARATANPAIEGSSAAFFIYGSDNVVIQDFNITNFATDGITITGDTGASGPSTNVRIAGCDVYNCRRNGLSIIHANGVIVDGGRYRNSNGAPSGPWAGIDIEPNNGEYARDINLRDVRTQENVGPGVLFAAGPMSATAGGVYDVTVIGGHSSNDGAVTGLPALQFASGGAFANEVFGQVVIKGMVIENPLSVGVGFKNWDAILAPRVVLDDVQVINPDGNGTATTNLNRTAFVINCDASQAVTSLGKITLRNCKAEDTRGTPRMVWGCYVGAAAAKQAQDILITDFTSVNYVSAAKYPVNTDVVSGGSFVDVVVSYANPKPVNSAATITDAGWGGQRINLTTAATAFALPLAALCKGLYYEIANDAATAGNCNVNRTGGDQIKSNGVGLAVTYVLQPADVVRVRSEGGTTWIAAPVA